MSPKVKNSSLSAAKKAKRDEFYTQLAEIEDELKHYRAQFKGKTVYCNCDDPRVSNFFHYFSFNFEKLGLKKLITTCYKSRAVDLFSQNDAEQAIYLEYEGDKDDNKVPDPSEIGIKPLEMDGDFRSQEAIELLTEADIVVTNPPFSLFREYLGQLIDYDKKFLIIGNQNAITYKEIFPLIKDNKLWLGHGFQDGNAYFATSEPEGYAAGVYDPTTGLVKFRNACWFTNMDTAKRHDDLVLYKTYNSDEYPKYDNYDAIEVSKVVDIPIDYDGVMGVPITFLDKYNPEQFEILGATQRGCHDAVPDTKKYDDYQEVRLDGTKTGSSGGKTNENANLVRNNGKNNYFINKDGRVIQSAYQRLFIRRKDMQQ